MQIQARSAPFSGGAHCYAGRSVAAVSEVNGKLAQTGSLFVLVGEEQMKATLISLCEPPCANLTLTLGH